MMIKLVRNKILLWFSFVFVFLIIITTTTTLAQSDSLLYFYCSDPGNYTTNSLYEKNLNTTFSILPTTSNGFGFYNLSTGQGNNTINSISLCRGDIKPDICLSCLNNAIGSIRQLCAYKISAITYLEYCSVMYSNETVLGNNDLWFYIYMANRQNTTNVDRFNGALRPLMDTLRAQASNGGPLKKFASGNTTGPDFSTIYALVQCTPDLSKQECNDCLENLINQIPRLFNGKLGGRIFEHMCNFRYEIYLFFNESNVDLAILPPPPSTQPPLVISPQPPPVYMEVNIVILLHETCYLLLREKEKYNTNCDNSNCHNDSHWCHNACFTLYLDKIEEERGEANTAYVPELDELIDPRNQSFTFLDIQRITDSFNTIIGKGGFGTVFYGYIGNNQVAVKLLSETSAQGYREFHAEVRLLMSVHHKNITSLVGYCNEGNQKGIIYEYMANGNLGMHLFDGSLNVLSWTKRLKIAYDAAQDFGLSRAFATEGATHVSTVICGTPGYLDPDYYYRVKTSYLKPFSPKNSVSLIKTMTKELTAVEFFK
ncbi:cysteine-rich RLK (RECEPTOR-like protein kinase) 25 [Artemisia annua]|uniref:Cysteine-rich RLK (RECEPTOR-like protein kinase) 25 n=1 Tax=Artemisia annua TaxID=35608 RepID=A0A2U1MRG0_ARTAN|nr:cysteine-rich RLK (RECEPTOR-like protein kinase) 25 [Artemisia annua]